MKDKNTQVWIPIYVDKWIFGSTRLELEPAERGVFVDLLALGAKDKGYIRANETMGYLPRQLAGLLNIDESLLTSTIAKCITFGKLEETSTGIYRISNWDKFQLSDDYKYRLETGRKHIPGASVRQNSDYSPKNLGPIVEEKRVEENRIEEKREEESIGRRFSPPTIQEVSEYIATNAYQVQADRFVNYYASKGWKVGKTPMKDWKAAVRLWASKEQKSNGTSVTPGKYAHLEENINE